MKKIAFLYLWFSVRGFIPRKKGLGISLSDYKARMTSQVSLMRSMNGKAGFVVFGDSNAENLDTVENRKQLGQGIEGFSLNFGIGGMRLDQWVEFLESADGAFLLELIRTDKPIVVINIGGNNALQMRMAGIPDLFKRLKILVPDAYACTCPPIHLGFFAVAGIDRDKLRSNVITINQEIQLAFQERTIDLYNPFMDARTGEAYFTILQDAVHFSDDADRKFRIPIIRKAVGLG